jgi:hypothetical protein
LQHFQNLQHLHRNVAFELKLVRKFCFCIFWILIQYLISHSVHKLWIIMTSWVSAWIFYNKY